MTRKIYMNVAEGDECRIAVLENGKLFEYFVDRPSQLKHVGNIYKAVVSNIEPGIQAAFVDIGLERNGFLHISDVNYAYEKNPKLTDLFSKTMRVKAPLPEDAILSAGTDRDVEEVKEFHAPDGKTNGKAPTEADFINDLEGDHPGHSVVESPLSVEPPKREIEAPAQPETTPGPAVDAPAKPDGDVERKRRRRRRRKRKNGEPTPETATAKNDPPKTDTQQSPSSPGGDAGDAAPSGAEKPAEAPAAKPKRRRRRLPKKRGGHLPKRVLEGEGAAPPEPNADSDATGNKDINGNGGGTPPAGPMFRYMRGGQPKIQGILKRDQEVVVQVTKASQGGKGPGLSTFVSLPGRYMVLTPHSDRGGVSRKIEDGSARTELRKMLDKLPVPEGMGVIIRTAAIDRSYDELLRDLNYLLRVWSVIVERIHDAPAPALLYTDSDPAIRAVRDYFTAETEEIVIDNREVYDRVVAFFDQLMPSFRNRVKLYEEPIPLFFAVGIEGEIEHIFDKKVPLKSGGYLFVEQTEALISIDVNSGKFTSAGDAEKTALLTNLEAIPEICRQLRLRDLAGIVCCDLIDMMSARNRTDVENALKRELRKDRARTKVARFSPFGVIEMTRQRVRPSIKSYTYVNCPTCNGFGMVRSAETLCLSLIRRMKLALVEERVVELAIQIHPHVLSHLHSEFREDVDELEERFGKRIVFEYARDLVLGQTRFFYINDRGVRVLYDMDQRINTFAKSDRDKLKTNVPMPVATSGGASPQTLERVSDPTRRKRRRGGRKQREREQERAAREQRIKNEGRKAVTFGDKLPDAPNIEVIHESPKEKTSEPNRRGRGSRTSRTPRQGAAQADPKASPSRARGRGSRTAARDEKKTEQRAKEKVQSDAPVSPKDETKDSTRKRQSSSSAKGEAATGTAAKEASGGMAAGPIDSQVEGENNMAKKRAAKKKPAAKKKAPAKKKPAAKKKKAPAKKKPAAKKKAPAKRKPAAKKKAPAKRKAAPRRRKASSSDE